MKLNSTQVEKTLSQFEAEVLPDNHPAVPQLHSMFGVHTFFIDDSGLNVLEPAEKLETEVRTGEVVSLASWSDATLDTEAPRTGTDRPRHRLGDRTLRPLPLCAA